MWQASRESSLLAKNSSQIQAESENKAPVGQHPASASYSPTYLGRSLKERATIHFRYFSTENEYGCNCYLWCLLDLN